jgi:hypothetical protein
MNLIDMNEGRNEIIVFGLTDAVYINIGFFFPFKIEVTLSDNKI